MYHIQIFHKHFKGRTIKEFIVESIEINGLKQKHDYKNSCELKLV